MLYVICYNVCNDIFVYSKACIDNKCIRCLLVDVIKLISDYVK